jgi:hypothetical protein
LLSPIFDYDSADAAATATTVGFAIITAGASDIEYSAGFTRE